MMFLERAVIKKNNRRRPENKANMTVKMTLNRLINLLILGPKGFFNGPRRKLAATRLCHLHSGCVLGPSWSVLASRRLRTALRGTGTVIGPLVCICCCVWVSYSLNVNCVGHIRPYHGHRNPYTNYDWLVYVYNILILYICIYILYIYTLIYQWVVFLMVVNGFWIYWGL